MTFAALADGVVVSAVESETSPSDAVMVTAPWEMTVTTPLLPCVLLTVAVPAADELQVTSFVMFLVLSSE